MKITIPEHIGDITLEQYQKYDEVLQRNLSDYDTAIRKISIMILEALILSVSLDLSLLIILAKQFIASCA